MLAVGRTSAAYGAGFVGGHLCPTFSIQTSGEKQEDYIFCCTEDISRIRTGFDWRSSLSSGVTAASGAGVVGGVVYPTPRIQSTHEKQEDFASLDLLLHGRNYVIQETL